MVPSVQVHPHSGSNHLLRMVIQEPPIILELQGIGQKIQLLRFNGQKYVTVTGTAWQWNSIFCSHRSEGVVSDECRTPITSDFAQTGDTTAGPRGASFPTRSTSERETQGLMARTSTVKTPWI